MQLSIELGYSSTQSVSVFESVEDTAELVTPARHAGALWIEANSLRLMRSDNTPVGPSLAFGESNTGYLSAQYPQPVYATGLIARHRRFPTRLALRK